METPTNNVQSEVQPDIGLQGDDFKRAESAWREDAHALCEDAKAALQAILDRIVGTSRFHAAVRSTLAGEMARLDLCKINNDLS